MYPYVISGENNFKLNETGFCGKALKGLLL